MDKDNRKPLLIVAALVFVAILIAILVAVALSQTSATPKATQQTTSADDNLLPKPVVEENEAYSGRVEPVAGTFSVKVPNGWKASLANTGTFRAIMFARPEQLNTLVYDKDAQPMVDTNGIPAWNGLTEHFYVITPAAGSQFDPAKHREVTSAPFTFKDGTVGTKYDVIKRAAEARSFGGLLRDDQWQGRTYIYEKDGKRVEAHLALYPSSKIDIPFYENVVKSIKTL